MKKLIVVAMFMGVMGFVGTASANDVATVQSEIAGHEKSRAEAQAEIDKLKIKLEKASNQVNAAETKVQELQAKLDAARNK